ncbi:hypothetical protein ASG81_19810 [Paenibacillus sp. Soil522]|nr:hypothetical protein ASG81_19810 [Paenibacillus sp. Soil522]
MFMFDIGWNIMSIEKIVKIRANDFFYLDIEKVVFERAAKPDIPKPTWKDVAPSYWAYAFIESASSTFSPSTDN